MGGQPELFSFGIFKNQQSSVNPSISVAMKLIAAECHLGTAPVGVLVSIKTVDNFPCLFENTLTEEDRLKSEE